MSDKERLPTTVDHQRRLVEIDRFLGGDTTLTSDPGDLQVLVAEFGTHVELVTVT